MNLIFHNKTHLVSHFQRRSCGTGDPILYLQRYINTHELGDFSKYEGYSSISPHYKKPQRFLEYNRWVDNTPLAIFSYSKEQ